MLEFRMLEQLTYLFQVLHDYDIRFIVTQPFKLTGLARKEAPGVDRRKYPEVVFLTKLEIFRTMTRCGVHYPRSRFRRHVLAQYDKTGAPGERMFCFQTSKTFSTGFAN